VDSERDRATTMNEEDPERDRTTPAGGGGGGEEEEAMWCSPLEAWND
jgi:hypothetical protein